MTDRLYNPFSLSGKQVLVTGASSGIGRAVAEACAQMGAQVYATARNLERLKETACAMGEGGHSILQADLSLQGDIDRLLDQLPKLDGIVHCAGIANRIPCKSLTLQDLEGIFQTNLYAPSLLQAALLRQKKVNKAASIVLLASRAATFPSPGNAAYSATKGALISYAKCLALELAPRLIRVNCICPGMVLTPLLSSMDIPEDILRGNQECYPLKRYGKPADIAHLAVYMLSDASEWMTGACIDISGGGEGVLTS